MTVDRTWGNLVVGPMNDYFGLDYPTNFFTAGPMLLVSLDSLVSGYIVTAGNGSRSNKDHTGYYTIGRGTSSGVADYIMYYYAFGS